MEKKKNNPKVNEDRYKYVYDKAGLNGVNVDKVEYLLGNIPLKLIPKPVSSYILYYIFHGSPKDFMCLFLGQGIFH